MWRPFSRKVETSPALGDALAHLERRHGDRPGGLDPLPALLRAAFGRAVPTDVERALSTAESSARTAAVARAVEGHHADSARLERAATRESERVGEIARSLVAGRQAEAVEGLRILDIEPGFGLSAFRFVLLPILEAHPVAIGRISQSSCEMNLCPRCARQTILAEDRGLERQRRLRCGFCAGEWPIERVCCPSCGTTDHHLLSLVGIEGEAERRRLLACEACNETLPVFATLRALSAPALVVAEWEADELRELLESAGT